MVVIGLSILLLGLVVSAAFFSLAEGAFFSLKPLQVRRLREKNPKYGQPLSELLEKPEQVLNVIVIGHTASIFAATVVFWSLFYYSFPGLHFFVVSFIVFLLLLIGTEIIPKTIAVHNPLQISLKIVHPFKVVRDRIRPVSNLFENLVSSVVRRATLRYKLKTTLNESEFQTVIQTGEEEGFLKETESAMIQSIVKLGDKSVRDVMTPRVDMVAVGNDWSTMRIEETIRPIRHRAIPVFDTTPDLIIGVLSTKRFLTEMGTDISEMMEPPLYVPETMKALTLLKFFLTRNARVAIVVDEFGGSSGVVTDGDIREEIFGDVEGDFDRKEWLIEKLAEGKYFVNGSTKLKELQEVTGIDVVEDDIDTVGGLVQVKLENNAHVGSVIDLPGARFIVQKISRHRVLQVMVEKLVFTAEQEEALEEERQNEEKTS
ncbi:MAG: hemolysin family protein [Verrucomicrobiota bacterium]|nr:hemolysin family protein [Verrucomicrobiota bacterium]